MKFSSPKDERKDKSSDEQNLFPLAIAKNEFAVPFEKMVHWQTAMNQYATEVLSTTKGFSPIITPFKKTKGLEGESVWRTPNSRHAASPEKRSLNIGTPDYKFDKKYN